MSDNKSVPDLEIVFCKRCGRKLRGEESRKIGFGPACLKLWKKEHSHQIILIDTTRGVKDAREQ